MKALLSVFFILSASFPSYGDQALGFSIDDLACTIGSRLREDLRANKSSLRAKRSEIMARLEAHQDYYQAVGITRWYPKTGKILFNDNDFFTQNAFVDLTLETRFPDQNWLGAYTYLERSLGLQRHRAKTDYDLIHDPKIVEKLEPLLPKVSNLQRPMPQYGCREDGSCVEVYLWSVDESKLTRAEVERYFSRFDRLASPLFFWLIQQPLESVSEMEFFEKAVEIYGDPWTAIGMVSWIVAKDAIDVENRGRGSIASSRLRPILIGNKEPASLQYHFWLYFAHDLLGGPTSPTLFNLYSFGYHKLGYGNAPQRVVDQLAFSLADKVAQTIWTPCK